MKKLILFCFFMAPLFFGCATTIPRSAQESRADIQAEMSRFEQAETISAGEIPDIYNVSRLSKGSNVKIKHTQNNSDKPYFITKIVRDVKTDNSGKVYVIDSIVGGRTFTFEEDTLSLCKIVSPYENIQPLTDFKGLPESGNLPTELVTSAITGGAVGVVMSVLGHSHMEALNRDATDYVKGMRIETKVIDFKFVSDETLKIAGKDISCKIYQAHSLIRQTMASTKRIPASSFITDKSEKMWVSEDIPFGVVKRESAQTLHMCMDGNRRFEPTSQIMRENSEVVEFSY